MIVNIRIHRTRNTGLGRMPQPYAKSATDKNFSAKANSRNPRTTLTVFNHPPDLGKRCKTFGNIAKKANGMAKARAKPNMPTAGPTTEPLVAASTNKVPIMGPVQEKDTSTKVNAIKKMLSMPVVLSACWSILLVQDAGKTMSKAPKKEMAKKTNRAKNSKLKKALVDKLFKALAPNNIVMPMPRAR